MKSTQTEAHSKEVLDDPEFSKLFMQQETAGRLKRLDDMSTEKFHESARAHTIAFAELPAVQKHQLFSLTEAYGDL
ncbi:hypothetical protein B0H19DRAFT_1263534 [Mycena capillaripes]|nr:hypothetical protein B0H19DRAFT_1263534 [Mycena capillaripes]